MAIKLSVPDKHGGHFVVKIVNGSMGGVITKKQMPAIWASILTADKLFNPKKRLTYLLSKSANKKICI